MSLINEPNNVLPIRTRNMTPKTMIFFVVCVINRLPFKIDIYVFKNILKYLPFLSMYVGDNLKFLSTQISAKLRNIELPHRIVKSWYFDCDENGVTNEVECRNGFVGLDWEVPALKRNDIQRFLTKLRNIGVVVVNNSNTNIKFKLDLNLSKRSHTLKNLVITRRNVLSMTMDFRPILGIDPFLRLIDDYY